ncbi:MAG: RibD family protein [Thiohalocapsa sp.]|nr:RibD family protein [Thiohalocapsa sp.]
MDGNSQASDDAGTPDAVLWSALRAAADLARRPDALPSTPAVFCADGRAGLRIGDNDAQALLCWDPAAGWRADPGLGPPARDFVDLYLPVCQPVAGASLAIGHLGQSLDGCIATRSGDSHFVNGPQNLRHLHRMRALCDAVIVGAGTVASDDPRLTTRLVPGPHPLRVILDPNRRLSTSFRVFTDAAAETLVCCASGSRGEGRTGQASVLELPLRGDRLDLQALVEALASRGRRRLFIEGGGITVSDFLAQGLLDRLQLAVAPLIIGRGRAGVSMPPCDVLADALRPPCRLYRMGSDVLYDFDLTRPAAAGAGQSEDAIGGESTAYGAPGNWPLRIG